MRFLRWTRYANRRWGALNRAEMLLFWQIVRTFEDAPRRDQGLQVPELQPIPPPSYEQLRLEVGGSSLRSRSSLAPARN